MDEIVVRKNLNITAIKTYIVAANNISGETLRKVFMNSLTKIDDIKQHLPDNVDIYINEFSYVPLEDEIPQALFQDAIASLLIHQDNNDICNDIIEETNKNLEKFSNELGVDINKIDFNQF